MNPASSRSPLEPPDVSRLDIAIAQYLSNTSESESSVRQQLLAEYPEITEELQAFFQDHAGMRQLASDLSSELAGEAAPCLADTMSEPRRYRDPSGIQAAQDEERAGRVGQRLGDYELLELLGRGGMGVVYKARQVSLNRIVAVKMIRRGEAASVEETLRFRTEAEAAAKLRHPSIVKVHAVGELEGQPFFAMELIEGPTLAQLVLSGPLAARRAAVYLEQIARAVEHAHRHGILHRDLKPANVLVDAADHVHVTDFGLAKSVHDDSELTQTGQMMGTASYVPPEQIYGRRQQVGPTSDVYGLGAILYELLTGRPPFRAETTWETLAEVCQRDPLLPRLLNPQIPRELELICLKCLEKSPAHRYPTAAALADDLTHYLQGESISIRSLNLLDRLSRTLSRSHHDLEFRAWGRMLLRFAAIIFSAHFAIFLVTRFAREAPWTWLTTIRIAEFVSMGAVLWLYRRAWFPPRGVPSRQLWSLWLGYVAGSMVLAVGGWLATDSQDCHDQLQVYPQLCVLGSLGFIMMGSSYWGYCYAFGALFLVLGLILPLIPAYSPLIFGAVWAACLVLLGKHLTRLASDSN